MLRQMMTFFKQLDKKTHKIEMQLEAVTKRLEKASQPPTELIKDFINIHNTNLEITNIVDNNLAGF